MDYKLLLIFIGLNIVNVIIQTVKSIATVKCGKATAAAVNALAYGLYTVVTVYMMCSLPLMWKAGIVALCNLVGVFIVKWIEEKARKEKLWKIEVTIPTKYINVVDKDLANIPHSYIMISSKHTLFNFYCETQKESQQVKELVKRYDAKYFVAESKIL
jgi:uncharacterized protein YebE (UPF0316 family)